MVGSHKKLFCQTNFSSFSLRHEDRFVFLVGGVGDGGGLVGVLKNSAKAYISKENKNQRTAEEFRHQTKIKIQFAENYTAFSLELLALLLLALRFGSTKQKTRFLKRSVRSKQLHWRTLQLLPLGLLRDCWISSLLVVNDHKASPVLRFVNPKRCPYKMSASWKERLRTPHFLHSLGTFALESSTFTRPTLTLVQTNSSEIMQVTTPFSSQNQIFSSDFTSFPHGPPCFHRSSPPSEAAAAHPTAVSFKQ